MEIEKRVLVVPLLKELLERIHGCSDTDCRVCRDSRRKIKSLGVLLGLSREEVADIIPRFLTKGGQE